MGHFSLFFKPVEVGIELAQNVFNTGQVFSGIRNAIGRFAAAFLVFRHARSLFQKQAKLFRLGLNDAADRALPNDGVSAWPESCTQKHVLHVPAANCLVVKVVA